MSKKDRNFNIEENTEETKELESLRAELDNAVEEKPVEQPKVEVKPEPESKKEPVKVSGPIRN